MRVGVIGLGKMGLSHYAIINADPDVEVAAVCDSSTYLLGLISRYNGVKTFTDVKRMVAQTELDAVLIATPSSYHAGMVRFCLENGLHVFCEKPFCLDPEESAELTRLALDRGLVTQVGYHNRFVGSFAEVKRLLEAGAIGKVSHVLAEAYGPVVLKPKSTTWRSRKSEGGGALLDYAAHPVDLLTWYFGAPVSARGTVLNQVFSTDADDEVFSTLRWGGGESAHLSVSWSDDSQRKMTTKVTLWGSKGRIYADRQECQVYLRDAPVMPAGYRSGWNLRYTTELTSPVQFYLRGEEYSAQLDSFVDRVGAGRVSGLNDFASATVTDEVLRMLQSDAATPDTAGPPSIETTPSTDQPGLIRLLRRGNRLGSTALRR